MSETPDPAERHEILTEAARMMSTAEPLPDVRPDDPAWQTYTYRDDNVTVSVDDGVLAIDPHGDTGIEADLPTEEAERVAMARAILVGTGATVAEAPTTQGELAEEIARALWDHESGGAPWEAAADEVADPGLQDRYLERARAMVTHDRSGAAAVALVVPDSPKMLRETLCIAASAVSKRSAHRRQEHLARLRRLVDECDRHRPLGPNGKHDDLHTATCGCEDAPATSHVADTASDSASGSQPGTDWARLALALIRGEEPADVDPTDPDQWDVACASLYGDQARLDRLTRERDQARAEVEEHRRWADHYRDQRDAAWSRVTPDAEHGAGITCTEADRHWSHTTERAAATAYRNGAEDMRERAADEADMEGQERLAEHIRHLELGDDATNAAEPAESGGWSWATATPDPDGTPGGDPGPSRMDAVILMQQHAESRLATPEPRQLAEMIRPTRERLGALAARVDDYGARLEDQGAAVGAYMREMATMDARVATLERTIRLAATTGDLHTAEDRCDDHARHVTGRLDALENRMLAAEQQGDEPEAPDDPPPADINNDHPLVYAVRRARAEGGHR